MRVGDLHEFGDGRGAVSQHKPEAHGTQNGAQRRQVQLPILHFAADRQEMRVKHSAVASVQLLLVKYNI